MLNIKTFPSFILLFLLFSCGGGGGGGSDPAPSYPLPTVSFSAESTEVLIGSETNLTWSSSNASSCSASGAWSGSRATSGSETVTISEVGNSSFTITCSGEGGSRSATVTIEGYRQTDGVVVDGYISGADIFIDENANFIADSEENVTTSDNEGKFIIKYADGSLVSIGGTDLDSQTFLDNLLITHKMTGHSDFKTITPVTSISAFMQDASSVNGALGIDPAIDIFTFDPVANKGDGGINDYLYEKGNQLTVLAFALQNIINDLNATTETTQDYFKAIAEEIDTEFLNTTTKVDIETSTFITNVVNNILAAKSITMDETAKANTIKALAGVLPIIQVKSNDDLTTAIIRFSLSTLQNDIVVVANGSATDELVTSYTTDILNYIAEDQNIDSNEITPDITATADTATLDEDGTVTIDVLANDSFITSAPIALSASDGLYGVTTLVESSPKQILYTPNADFNGTDSILYAITQGDKTSGSEVIVTVNAVNDAPSIDIASTIEVSENQTAVTTVSVSDVDEDELTLTLGGTDADSFNLSNENVLTFKESPNFEDQSSYSITLSLSDGFETTSKNIQIIIDDVQEVFINPDEVTEQEDSDIRIDVLKNDSFSGANYDISFDNPVNGTLVIDEDPEALEEYGHKTLIFSPVLNWFGEENITYYLSAGGETRSGDIKVTYIPVNDPPVIDSITQTIDVSVEPNSNGTGNVYVINGQQAKELKFNNAVEYRFVHPEEHPLRFSTTADGTHNGGSEYLENVDTSTPGVTVISFSPNQTELNLYYYCDIHPGMGSIFAKSEFLINTDENLSGSLLTIAASDVDDEILSFSITGDDVEHFSRNDEGQISIDVEPDFENPIDKNLDNKYLLSLNVSDGRLSATQEIDVKIIDLNLPATLLKEFSSDCVNTKYGDTDFGSALAIDADASTVIFHGRRTPCPQSQRDSQVIAYEKVNNQWKLMESLEIRPGSQVPNNPIYGGHDYHISDDGLRFAKRLNTCLIPYDYNTNYSGVYNWNSVEERGGESSTITAQNGCQGGGGTAMSGDGMWMAVFHNFGTNQYGAPTSSRLKIHFLQKGDNVIAPSEKFTLEQYETSLGQAVIRDVAFSYDGKVAVLSLASLEVTNSSSGGHFRVLERNDSGTYEFVGDRVFYCENNFLDGFIGDDHPIQISSDGKTLTMSAYFGRYGSMQSMDYGSVCVYEKTNNEWKQKGTLFDGRDLNPDPDDGGRLQVNTQLSGDGKRLIFSYQPGSDTINRAFKIYDWSIIDNNWKQSGPDIQFGDDGFNIEEGFNRYKLSRDGTTLAALVKNSPTGSVSEGRVRLYFLPKN